MKSGLFRGKRKENGEWVEGYYFERKDSNGDIIESVIIQDAYEQVQYGRRYLSSDFGNECFRVDPSTVTQNIATDWIGDNIIDRKIEPGIYKHFKGGCYEVISVARGAETGEQYVVYKALYGNCTVFVRALKSFASEVDKEKYVVLMRC